ncbi:FAD-binding domain-containing protein [Mucidula mucida]|nr:FAD-binding domain-containing protein [Mucidula mucida]
MTSPISDLFADLQSTLPEGSISRDPKDLTSYAHSKYPQFKGSPHSVVVHAQSTADVVEVVKLANKHRVPIVAYSGGTSLEGNLSGTGEGGSICLDLSGMNKIIKINEEDSDVVCEAGVMWNVLNATLKEKGIPLFFPLDPAPGATIGGMIAQGCSGTNAVRYGTARGEYILNLTAVLASGEVIKTRQRARKSSAGFDLTKLFIGAEGTLGIVTEATLRLAPVLPISVAVVSFPNVHSATSAVTDILKLGASIQCAEIIDDIGIRAMNKYGKSSTKWQEVDTILLKYQGSTAVMLDSSQMVEGVIAQHGGYSYHYIQDGAQAQVLWDDRKNGLFGVLQSNPGKKGFITDVCVPVSRLPDIITWCKNECMQKGLIAPMTGHVGDGNFHAFILYGNEDEFKAAQEIVDSMNRKAIELDGTCTGEHGVGLGKKMYLTEELGEGTVALMKTIKAALDPLNLLNPGKLYPDGVPRPSL